MRLFMSVTSEGMVLGSTASWIAVAYHYYSHQEDSWVGSCQVERACDPGMCHVTIGKMD